jgi:hypothetical protein
MTWAAPVRTYDEINLVGAEEEEENSTPRVKDYTGHGNQDKLAHRVQIYLRGDRRKPLALKPIHKIRTSSASILKTDYQSARVTIS